MMNDVPMPTNGPLTKYDGQIDEDCKAECLELCGEKSISQLRAIGDFFYNKASELSKIAENDLTIEDFENAKKEDLDGDQGEGETHGF